MKHTPLERMVGIFLVVLILGFGWGTAWSEFYVIAAGKAAKRTILVSPKNTAIQSGTALLNAVDKTAEASETMPFLIIIEPGIYDIQGNTLQMNAYVDIQGSGENVTKITGNINASDSGVLCGADNAELRFLTVENTGSGENSNAVYNALCSPKMTHVTAIASGGTNNYGVHNVYASPLMIHVTATALGGTNCYGIFNAHSPCTMTNVTATGAKGTNVNFGLCNYLSNGSALYGGIFKASGGTDAWGIYNTGSGSVITADSVTALGEDGSSVSSGLYNESAAVAQLYGGTFTASGGTDTRGIYNTGSGSVVTAESVTALGEDGSDENQGLYTNFGAVAKLRSGSFTGRGGNTTRGIIVKHSGAVVELENASVIGEGGITNHGFEAASSSGTASTVTESILEGAQYSVVTTGSGGPVYVSNSRLVGVAVGNITCTAVSRGTSISSDGSTCP